MKNVLRCFSCAHMKYVCLVQSLNISARRNVGEYHTGLTGLNNTTGETQQVLVLRLVFYVLV